MGEGYSLQDRSLARANTILQPAFDSFVQLMAFDFR